MILKNSSNEGEDVSFQLKKKKKQKEKRPLAIKDFVDVVQM